MKYNSKNIMSVFMKGDSAFEIYKKHHPEFTGTEEEWLESLKGEPYVLTDEDKAEFKAYVDEAILGGEW